MTQYNSPLGKKTFSSSQNPRIFDIPDESETLEAKLNQQSAPPQYNEVNSAEGIDPTKWKPGVAVQLTPEQFNAMMAQRQAVKEDVKKVNQFSRDRINILTNIGRVKVQVPIGENTFTLRSLKDKEVKQIFNNLGDIKNASQLALALRTGYLSYSICEIDGHSIGDVLGISETSDNYYESIAQFLEESEDYVVTHLYDKYNEMVNDIRKKFSVNTDEKSKEVVEEIKKS